MNKVQGLILLIIAGTTTQSNIQCAERTIQRAIDDSARCGDMQLSEQLKLVGKAVSMMAQPNVSPKELQNRVTSLLTSSLQLDSEALLMAVNQATQLQLALDVPELEERVKTLHEAVKTFVEVTKQGQIAISADIESVKGFLLQFANEPRDRAVLNENWIAQVCCQLPKPGSCSWTWRDGQGLFLLFFLSSDALCL